MLMEAGAVLGQAASLSRHGPWQIEATIQSVHSAGGGGRPPHDGLTSLNALPAARLASHQPFWAVPGHLLALLGKPEAAETYRHSAGLSHDPAVREWLLARVRP